jgi:xylan 1,4-beta-xylosidase
LTHLCETGRIKSCGRGFVRKERYMPNKYSNLPVSVVDIKAGTMVGPLEVWRHTFGLGGINTLPIPPKVQDGIGRFHPRLVRIFIQEFFQIYPAHGRFDWSRLDPYMDALAKTGAKIVAALCIKPKPLFPVIDQTIWRPNDVKEWQHVVGELARR